VRQYRSRPSRQRGQNSPQGTTAGRKYSSIQKWTTYDGIHSHTNWVETRYVFDGDGRPVIEKKGSRQVSPNPGTMTVTPFRYQVWSSVLGSSVTTVIPSGEKMETRVFAGRAVIAKQNAAGTTTTTSDDAITFTTSDPVTGTVASYSHTRRSMQPISRESSQMEGVPSIRHRFQAAAARMIRRSWWVQTMQALMIQA
jgi:hypothetical protein